MWTDAGIGQRILMVVMVLLMLVIVVLTLWLVLAPLWEGFQNRRAEIRRQRHRAAKRAARLRGREAG